MIVNFFDQNISHAKSYNDALEAGRATKTIEYVFMQQDWNGITVFTDNMISRVNTVTSKYKVAWIMEPRAFSPSAYRTLENNIQYFDLVLSYDPILLAKFPEKVKFMPADGIFVDTEATFTKQISKKRLISHIFSNKTMLEGHSLRHSIASEIVLRKHEVDFYGTGTKTPLSKKSDGLLPYYFSIIVENNKDDNYFTEKILDAFACRTIPIYWGAGNIEQWFDTESIIRFDSIPELMDIISNLSINEYNKRFESLEKNYNKSLHYYDYDDILYQNLLRYLYHDR